MGLAADPGTGGEGGSLTGCTLHPSRVLVREERPDGAGPLRLELPYWRAAGELRRPAGCNHYGGCCFFADGPQQLLLLPPSL